MFKYEERKKEPVIRLSYYSLDTCHIVYKPLKWWQRVINRFISVDQELIGYNIRAEIRVEGNQDYLRIADVVQIGETGKWLIENSWWLEHIKVRCYNVRNIDLQQSRKPFHSHQYILKLYSAYCEGGNNGH